MKVLLTGGSGLLGSAILRLQKTNHPKLKIIAPTSKELNLLNTNKVIKFIKDGNFDVVIHSATMLESINTNDVSTSLETLYLNNKLNNNIIESCIQSKISRLIFLSSAAIYRTEDCEKSFTESDLLSGELNQLPLGYVLTKIMTGKFCEYATHVLGYHYKTIIPCTFYGPEHKYIGREDFLTTAAFAKILNAIKNQLDIVEIWGDGESVRNLLYVDDLANFIINILPKIDRMPDYLNIGSSEPCTVNDYYNTVADVVGYKGKFTHNLNKPSGTKRRILDCSLAKKLFNWDSTTSLKDGVQLMYAYMIEANKI